MRRFTIAAMASISLLGALVVPANAQLTRWSAAMQWITNDCVRYTGCSQISINQTATDGSCRRYHYNYHTKWYGWKDGWTGPYCAPPYAP